MKQLIYITTILFIFLSCGKIEPKWERKIDAAGHGNYQINGLHVSHDVYVTGSFWEEDQQPWCITAAYNEKGELEWYTMYGRQNIKTTTGTSIAGNHEGIYVLIHGADVDDTKNTTLVKYNDLGGLQWERIVEQSIAEITSEMLLDRAGNIYIAGWTTDAEDFLSIFVAKYRPSGELAWFSKYANPTLRFNHLKFDIETPNLFLVGGIFENSQDLFFLRYDSLGQFSGLTQYENPEQEIDLADIKTDDAGNVYLTGTSLSHESGNDYLTLVYDSDDELIWAKRYDGQAHSDDIPKAIAVDESSNVYVTGSSKDTNGTTGILTIKYDSDGNELWSKAFKAKKDKSAEPYILLPRGMYDGKDVGGFYIIGTVGDDVLLLKYNTNGYQSWVKTYSSGKEKMHIPVAFSGNYLAVQSISDEIVDAIIIKYGESEIFGIARWD